MSFSLRTALVLLWTLGLGSCADTNGKNAGSVECEGDADCDPTINDHIGMSGSGGRPGIGGAAGTAGTAGTAGISGAAGVSSTAGTGSAGRAGSAGSTGGVSGASAGTGSAACFFGGLSHRDGETFASGCNECLCANGTVICTDVACPSDVECSGGACRVGDFCYADGATGIVAPDGCNQCSCADGTIYCTDECEPMCPASSCEHLNSCIADGVSGIAAGDGCNTCSCDNGDLSCTSDTCERFDEPPCETGACEVDGVCYPLNEVTENGCCTCEAGGISCTTESWCAVIDPIGTRCQVDGDCQPGLDCRHELAGERGMCLRACRFGCPTGTECADGIPGYNGGFIDDICLRTCNVSADCEPYGSECDMLSGTDRRYCF
jgi:hypothetical protein